ncbi:tRNA pseudouridine(55) synthase TruB [Solimonas sp. K1W22B-7]|uniref:tRNA pseudouridine(55) synthase TruB n=1 Tax=Solimonas sp. K1W22B-7 TaxID=2303331 RepID=UPI000E334E38|nr:tRNA pseudouridine(55) synthase TruB [Solimonas sp. K1W22B-7]AXQ29206.1 tRNA pseudouridine(55) synthase TruB [Solimonas sp. K1W22B-7]
MKSRIPRRPVHGILLFDKPLGLSSNDALQRVKRLFRAEKAGHTGSLDPLASGMLPICFGQSTKLCGYLLDSDKRYTARLRLGEKTVTGDAEGEVIARSDASLLTREALEAVLPAFTGPIIQVPPMYSAIKVQGQRLYELAREGVEIERQPRQLTIHALRLTAFGGGECELEVHCSKGTYIRTLAEDIAAAAGHCAHLAGLRRSAVDPFEGELLDWAALEALAVQGEAALDACLIDPAQALRDWPQLRLEQERAHYLERGQAVRVAGAPREGRVAVLDEGGRLLCLAEIDADGMVAPRRWMAAPPAGQ